MGEEYNWTDYVIVEELSGGINYYEAFRAVESAIDPHAADIMSMVLTLMDEGYLRHENGKIYGTDKPYPAPPEDEDED